MSEQDFLDAITRFSTYPAQTADAAGVSVPTVLRWLEGRNLPHPLMRESIVRALEAE